MKKANEVLQQNNEDLLRKVKDLSTKKSKSSSRSRFFKRTFKTI